MDKLTGWIVGDATGTKLFIGPKPEKINGTWTSCNGHIGRLPQQMCPYKEFVDPVSVTLVVNK